MQVVAKQLGAIFRVGCGGGASTTAASAAIVNTTSRRGLAAAPAKAGASMKLGGGLSSKQHNKIPNSLFDSSITFTNEHNY